MFNAISTEDLIIAMGRTMRAAVDAEGRVDDYARGQLLSAYSISRLLAAEVRAEAELLAWLRAELLAALAEADRGNERVAATAAERIEAAADGAGVGAALVDLLVELRADPDQDLSRRLHAILREMATRELAALAARPERSARPAAGDAE